MGISDALGQRPGHAGGKRPGAKQEDVLYPANRPERARDQDPGQGHAEGVVEHGGRGEAADEDKRARARTTFRAQRATSRDQDRPGSAPTVTGQLILARRAPPLSSIVLQRLASHGARPPCARRCQFHKTRPRIFHGSCRVGTIITLYNTFVGIHSSFRRYESPVRRRGPCTLIDRLLA